MGFKVTNIRNNAVFEVDGSETMLDAALRQGRIYPYSCRNGTCGSCKCKLLSGQVDRGHFDTRALSESEIAREMILLCQSKPLEDVTIDAQEIASGGQIQIKTLPCRVIGMIKRASDVMELHLKLPQNQNLEYLPGQYIDILLRDGRRRSYSIANQPDATGQLQLHVRYVEGGAFSRQVFKQMRERDLMRLQGPFGTFFLRPDSNSPVILIAGGTGFAPIRAILQQAFAENPGRRLHLFWGVRSREDLYADDAVRQWATEYESFEYTPVLSEPRESDDWQGAAGWVHDEVTRRHPDLSGFEVYAAGPPAMIDAIKRDFPARGLSSERLFFDSFEHATDA